MQSLFSNRLRLIPLNLYHLTCLKAGRNELECVLGLNMSNFELSAPNDFLREFTTAIDSHIIPLVTRNEKHYAWYTHWLIVLQELNLTVGGVGVSGLPDENGQTMLGYFIDKKFEGRGIASEAVHCLLDWLFQHDNRMSVIADTPVNHISSQRVLQKNGFLFAGEVEEGYRWIITR